MGHSVDQNAFGFYRIYLHKQNVIIRVTVFRHINIFTLASNCFCHTTIIHGSCDFEKIVGMDRPLVHAAKFVSAKKHSHQRRRINLEIKRRGQSRFSHGPTKLTAGPKRRQPRSTGKSIYSNGFMGHFRFTTKPVFAIGRRLRRRACVVIALV